MGHSWEDRIQALREDLEEFDVPRLFFLLHLCRIDAYDNHDYDRHEIILKALSGLDKGNTYTIANALNQLEQLGEK